MIECEKNSTKRGMLTTSICVDRQHEDDTIVYDGGSCDSVNMNESCNVN